MRPEVHRLLDLGRVPADEAGAPAEWEAFGEAVGALKLPATDAEAIAGVDVLPDADTTSYRLAWTLLHFVESAPGWPIAAVLDRHSPWIDRLRERAGHALS
jgi:hypothetical protein